MRLTCTTWKSSSVSNKRKGEEGEEEVGGGGKAGGGGGRRKGERERTADQTHLNEDTHTKTKKSVRGWLTKEAKCSEENRWHQTWVDPLRPQPSCNYLAQWAWALGMDPKGLGLDPSLWTISLTVFPSLSWPFSLPQATVFSFWPLRLFAYKMGTTILFPSKFSTSWPVFKHLHNLHEGIRMSMFKSTLSSELMCFFFPSQFVNKMKTHYGVDFCAQKAVFKVWSCRRDKEIDILYIYIKQLFPPNAQTLAFKWQC